MPAPSARVFYVDATRAFAILLVVVSHVFAPVVAGMHHFPLGIWWVFNLADAIIRPAVPLFIMISGKLLLGTSQQRPYLEFIGRRFKKILPAFFVWSLIYAWYEARISGSDFSLLDGVAQFLQGPTEFHLWFMYVIPGLYLIAPFLRRFVQNASRDEIAALLVLWAGFQIVQFFFPGYGGSGGIMVLLGYVGFFVLGYVLDHTEFFAKKTGLLAAVALATVLINAFATFYLTRRDGGVLNEKFYGGLTPLVGVDGIALFLIFKHLDYDRFLSRAVRGVVSYFSLDAYNLYLNHVFFIWVFIKGHLGFVLNENTGGSALIGVTLTSAAVLAASLACSAVLQRIPLVNKVAVIPAS